MSELLKAPTAATDPQGRLERARFVKLNAPELRAQAAMLWVDMEESLYQDGDGKPWTGSPSKNEIAVRLGFPFSYKHMPAFLRDPEFGRAVEYERIRRLVGGGGRLTKDEIATLASMVARAGLLEVARRMVMNPEKITSRELLPEVRNYAKLAAEVGSSEAEERSVHQTINVFMQSSGRLPPKAREKYRGLFKESMERLAIAAGSALEGNSK